MTTAQGSDWWTDGIADGEPTEVLDIEADLAGQAARLVQAARQLEADWTAAAHELSPDQTAELRKTVADAGETLRDLTADMLRCIGESGTRTVLIGDIVWEVKPRWRDVWDRDAVRAAVLRYATEHDLDPVQSLLEAFRAADPAVRMLPRYGIVEPGDYRDREQTGWQLVQKGAAR